MKLVKAKKFVSFAVKQILTKHLAPDTICGLAKEKGCFTELVCSKTLYNYIERGLLKARNIDLTLKVKRKQHRKGHPQHKRLYGLSIEARPQVVSISGRSLGIGRLIPWSVERSHNPFC